MTSATILLVEDDPVLRAVGRRQLNALGLKNVVIAESGEAALELCQKKKPTLIFMDIGLPGMDGTEVTVAIREQESREQLSRTPIVALTAHSDKQRCLEAGMDDFLQKPAMLDDLREILLKWLHEDSDNEH